VDGPGVLETVQAALWIYQPQLAFGWTVVIFGIYGKQMTNLTCVQVAPVTPFRKSNWRA